MPTIQVDGDVFAFLQRNAKPFIDTPNSTLRRLLDIGPAHAAHAAKAEIAGSANDELDQLLKQSMENQRTKAPKASLKALVRAGLLREGERLFLIDYKGMRVSQREAAVSGTGLLHKGQHYAMSDLAKELLKQVGFSSNSVRGPLHWSNAKGNTVASLWQQVLDRRATPAE